MKVLYISDESDKYGAPKALLETINSIRKNKNIKPVVLTSKYNKINEFCNNNDIENYVSYYPTWMMTKKDVWYKFLIKFIIKFLKHLVFSMVAVRKIEKKIDISSIDIIHTNTSIIDIGAKLAKKYNKKHFWHLREFGKEDYDMISFNKNYIKFMNLNTYEFLAISKAVKECWINKGIDINKVTLFYDGIQLDDIHEKDMYNDNKIKIVMVGYISESKGQIELIKAIEKMDLKFKEKILVDIIGSGKVEYVDSIKKYVKEKKIDNIINFLGYKENIRELLHEYDIGLMCSKSEGFGRTTAEYMATGLITIASNTGANLELIINEVNGFVYEYGNIKNLTNILEKILSQINKYRYVGKNAQNTIRRKFNLDLNTNDLFCKYNTSKEK